MTLRVPVIEANAAWSTNAVAAPATIYSPIYISPKKGYTIVTGANPADNNTLILTTPAGSTYRFKSTPTTDLDVQIGAAAADTWKNLVLEINKFDSDLVDAWVDIASGSAYIQSKAAGDGNDIVLGGTYAAIAAINAAAYNGHNGARDFSGQAMDIYVDGVSTPVLLPAFVDIDNAQDVAVEIAADIAPELATTVEGIAVNIAASGRVYIYTATNGADRSLQIFSVTPAGTEPALFNVGEYAVGVTANHPASDTAGTDLTVRMFHPADPVFFRNDNRPILDLIDNDKRLHRDFILLKEGYDTDDGTTEGSSSLNTTFRAPNGYTFDTDVRFNGDIILQGSDVLQQNVTILSVADRTITLNAGETGTGVDGGTANVQTGILVDRGSYTDTQISWYEAPAGGAANASSNYAYTASPLAGDGGYWLIDGPVIGTANSSKTLVVGRPDPANNKSLGTVVEFEQVTVGDGVSTFGTFNDDPLAPNTSHVAIQAAIDFLGTTGGKVYIKRGTYTFGANVVIDDDAVTISGEGFSTFIKTTTFNFEVDATAANIDGIVFENMRLQTGVGTCIELGTGGNSAVGTMIRGCWFEETVAATDVTLTSVSNNIYTGNISSCTTTNI